MERRSRVVGVGPGSGDRAQQPERVGRTALVRSQYAEPGRRLDPRLARGACGAR